MKYYFDTKYELYIETPIEQEGENLVEITKEQWLEALGLRESDWDIESYVELRYKRAVKRSEVE